MAGQKKSPSSTLQIIKQFLQQVIKLFNVRKLERKQTPPPIKSIAPQDQPYLICFIKLVASPREAGRGVRKCLFKVEEDFKQKNLPYVNGKEKTNFKAYRRPVCVVFNGNADLTFIIKSCINSAYNFITTIPIKNLDLEKNSYFTQPFFSLCSFFSASLSGFSCDFSCKALESKRHIFKFQLIYPNPEKIFIPWDKTFKVPLRNEWISMSEFMWELRLSPFGGNTVLPVSVPGGSGPWSPCLLLVTTSNSGRGQNYRGQKSRCEKPPNHGDFLGFTLLHSLVVN